MKKSVLLSVVVLLSGFAFSQSGKKSEKMSLSVLLNYTTPKQEAVYFTSIVRATYPLFNKIYIGSELNYLMRYGKYGNSDFAGGILFGKMNPYLGFTAEIGYSFNKLITGRRNEMITKGLFASIGYQARINDHWSVCMQYRALPGKYLENNVINSRVFLLGASYILLKKQE